MYPHTQSLERPAGSPAAKARYYFEPVEDFEAPTSPDRLFVILTFSGGGTRAAAFSYGVLDELRRIKLDCRTPGEASTCSGRTLLDEVDVISSVSGGSFTAAYYALNGADMFNQSSRFQTGFLHANTERELIGEAIYYPRSWLRLLSRPEIAANLWSKRLFGSATFQDLATRPGRRPFIILNASDYVTQSRFQFTQDYFDWLCADLNPFSIGRAVAASSAFPGLLNSMTVNTHNQRCGVNREPPWRANALLNQFENRQDYRAALAYDKLSDTRKRYLHLLDGGLTDNLGLRAVYEGLRGGGAATLPLARLNNVGATDNLLIVVVNARTGDKPGRFFQPDSAPIGPMTLPVIGATSSLPMGTVSYDSVDMLTELVDAWQQNRAILIAENEKKGVSEPPMMNVYAVEVTFENIGDDVLANGTHTSTTRDFFRHLATDFALPASSVDCLDVEGRRLLQQAKPYGGSSETPGQPRKSFSEFVATTLHGYIPPETEDVVVDGNRCTIKKP